MLASLCKASRFPKMRCWLRCAALLAGCAAAAAPWARRKAAPAPPALSPFSAAVEARDFRAAIKHAPAAYASARIPHLQQSSRTRPGRDRVATAGAGRVVAGSSAGCRELDRPRDRRGDAAGPSRRRRGLELESPSDGRGHRGRGLDRPRDGRGDAASRIVRGTPSDPRRYTRWWRRLLRDEPHHVAVETLLIVFLAYVLLGGKRKPKRTSEAAREGSEGGLSRRRRGRELDSPRRVGSRGGARPRRAGPEFRETAGPRS